MDATQNRIRTLQNIIEKLDELDMVVGLDAGGHVVLELYRSEATALKKFLAQHCSAEIENMRQLQKWSAWTSGANKEAVVQ